MKNNSINTVVNGGKVDVVVSISSDDDDVALLGKELILKTRPKSEIPYYWGGTKDSPILRGLYEKRRR